MVNDNLIQQQPQPIDTNDPIVTPLTGSLALIMVAIFAQACRIIAGYISNYNYKNTLFLPLPLRKAKAKAEEIDAKLYELREMLNADSSGLIVLHNGETSPTGYHFVKAKITNISTGGGSGHIELDSFSNPFLLDVPKQWVESHSLSPFSYHSIMVLGNLIIGAVYVRYSEPKETIEFTNEQQYLIGEIVELLQ
jgi:hypothetical protein